MRGRGSVVRSMQIQLIESDKNVAQNWHPAVSASRTSEEGVDREVLRQKLLPQMRKLCRISRVEAVMRIVAFSLKEACGQ